MRSVRWGSLRSSRWLPWYRWRWASAPTRRCSRFWTRSCWGCCRSKMRNSLSCSPCAAGTMAAIGVATRFPTHVPRLPRTQSGLLRNVRPLPDRRQSHGRRAHGAGSGGTGFRNILPRAGSRCDAGVDLHTGRRPHGAAIVIRKSSANGSWSTTTA